MDDPELTTKVKAWLRSHGIQDECRECGARGKERVGNLLAPKPLLATNAGDKYGTGIPTVEVACGDCGHVRYFASKAIGLKP